MSYSKERRCGDVEFGMEGIKSRGELGETNYRMRTKGHLRVRVYWHSGILHVNGYGFGLYESLSDEAALSTLVLSAVTGSEVEESRMQSS